jgi:hypothetical protein
MGLASRDIEAATDDPVGSINFDNGTAAIAPQYCSDRMPTRKLVSLPLRIPLLFGDSVPLEMTAIDLQRRLIVLHQLVGPIKESRT